MNPTLMREFNHASETFTNLEKAASENYNECGEEDQNEPATEQVHNSQGTTAEVYNHVPAKEYYVDVGWGYSMVAAPSPRKHTSPPSYQSDNHFQQFSSSYSNSMNEHEQSSLVPRRQFSISEVIDQPGPTQSTLHQQPAHFVSNQQSQSPFNLVDVLNSPRARYAPPTSYECPVTLPTSPTPRTPRLQFETPPMQMSPNLLGTRTLAPIKSHANDETSFARLLLRTTLESAFRLLTYEGPIRPMALNHVFRLSLYFFNIDNLRARFKDLLSRSVDEELDWWEAPFLHLGGAGTHYPRRDSTGNIIFQGNSWTIRHIGPVEKRMVRIESIADGRWQDVNGVDLSGFEGEWFDAYDVQGYLEERWGCKIDPTSAFAECWANEEDESLGFNSSSDCSQPEESGSSGSPSLSQGSTATRSSNQQYEYVFNAAPEAPFGLDMLHATGPIPTHQNKHSKVANLDMSFDQTLGLDLAPGLDFSVQNFDVHTGWTSESEANPTAMQKSKKMAWIEVPKLINSEFSSASRKMFVGVR